MLPVLTANSATDTSRGSRTTIAGAEVSCTTEKPVSASWSIASSAVQPAVSLTTPATDAMRAPLAFAAQLRRSCTATPVAGAVSERVTGSCPPAALKMTSP